MTARAPRETRRGLTRRELLKTSAAAGIGFWLGTSTAQSRPLPASEKLNIAVIGLGGRGRANLNAVAGENVIALCDVDDERAGDAYKRFPRAKKFHDFRRMYDELEKQIDAVVISTPDHTHFHPAYAALELGKHVYLEKPMAHSVWEVRTLTDLARKRGVATQLGVQRHTHDNVHRVVELVKGGAIGVVKECHAWVGGDRGMPSIPKEHPPVPDHLKWDLWLGPASDRPYNPTYCPYGWRFWWDFGTGETGNWGCHVLDIPFWALDLKYPTRVAASGPPVHDQTTPRQMETHFEFPARASRPAVTLHWSHSKKGPEVLRRHGLPHFGTGVLFVGSEGMLLCDFGKRRLFPEEKFADFQPPERTIPDSPGFHREWITACKGGQPATCHFDYTGPMTETVLLGNVAYRAGTAFEWDAKNIRPRGSHPEVEALIRPPYRKGWVV